MGYGNGYGFGADDDLFTGTDETKESTDVLWAGTDEEADLPPAQTGADVTGAPITVKVPPTAGKTPTPSDGGDGGWFDQTQAAMTGGGGIGTIALLAIGGAVIWLIYGKKGGKGGAKRGRRPRRRGRR